MIENALISTHWLAQNLYHPNLRIVDIRGHVLPASEPPPHYFAHRSDYEASHIPSAVFVDWTKDIVAENSPSQDVIGPQGFSQLMGRLGISHETWVIAYDDADGMFAARLWWALRYYGHERVSILDGGWQKWLSEKLPVTAEIPKVPSTTFVPRIQEHLRKTGEEVHALLGRIHLIDARSSAEFAGQSSRAKRFGHIPSAKNLPRTMLVNADGTMIAAEKLRAHLSEMGIAPEDEIVLYCNAGVSASYNLLALQIAGYGAVSLYDGSWKDWGNDETRPIE